MRLRIGIIKLKLGTAVWRTSKRRQERGVKTKVGAEGVPMLENTMTGENTYFQMG
jgi:hypothetical protein